MLATKTATPTAPPLSRVMSGIERFMSGSTPLGCLQVQSRGGEPGAPGATYLCMAHGESPLTGGSNPYVSVDLPGGQARHYR
jgi:hypothetical protein